MQAMNTTAVRLSRGSCLEYHPPEREHVGGICADYSPLPHEKIQWIIVLCCTLPRALYWTQAEKIHLLCMHVASILGPEALEDYASQMSRVSSQGPCASVKAPNKWIETLHISVGNCTSLLLLTRAVDEFEPPLKCYRVQDPAWWDINTLEAFAPFLAGLDFPAQQNDNINLPY